MTDAAHIPQPIPEKLTFTELAPHEKGFAAFYDREIAPDLAGLEAKRLVIAAQIKRRVRWSIPMYVVSVLGGITLSSIADGNWFFYVGVFLIPLGIYAWSHEGAEAYSVEQKTLIIKAAKFFGDFKYQHFAGIPSSSVRRTRLILVASDYRVHVNDALIGTHQGKRIDVAHVQSMGSNSSKSTSGDTVYFDGLLIMAKLNKRRFHGITVVRDMQARMAIPAAEDAKFQHVDLESNEFERQFDVRSTDQLEARYLLTPDVMHELLEMNKDARTDNLAISFVDNVLCVAINGAPSLFPSGGFTRPAADTSYLRSFLERMTHALYIVDKLDG